jgi:hypothetical protein
MSWRTTFAGIVTIIIAILGAAKALLDGDATTNPDYPSIIAAITAGLGLIKARDNVVTSADVKANS